jgi:hypothetical protein
MYHEIYHAHDRFFYVHKFLNLVKTIFLWKNYVQCSVIHKLCSAKKIRCVAKTVKVFLFKLSKFSFSKLSKLTCPNCQSFPFQTVKISFSNRQNFPFQTVKIFPFQTVKFSFSNCQNFHFQTVKIFLFKLSKFSPFKLSNFHFPNCQNFLFQTVKIYQRKMKKNWLISRGSKSLDNTDSKQYTYNPKLAYSKMTHDMLTHHTSCNNYKIQKSIKSYKVKNFNSNFLPAFMTFEFLISHNKF